MLRTILKYGFPGFVALLSTATPAVSQDHPARRLSNIVAVAVEEYAKGVDARGRVVLEVEYQEALGFLTDAKGVASRLPGEGAPAIRVVLDSLITAVRERRPPAAVAVLHAHFASALGSEGALELPSRAVSIASGRSLYAANCASCHGDRGMGDGPAAAGMNPPSPAIGSVEAMRDVSPALMYRVVTVGIAGTPMIAWSSALTSDERWDIVAYLTSLRSTPDQTREGQRLLLRHCATCVDSTGPATRMVSGGVTRLRSDLTSFEWQAARSDAQLAEVIRAAIPDTSTPSKALGGEELQAMVAYVRTLSLRDAGTVAAKSRQGNGHAVARAVMGLIEGALAAGRAGKINEANDLALDAYLAFEPLETPARVRAPGPVAAMERHFLELKAALRSNDIRTAEHARDAIGLGMPSIVDMTKAPVTGWAAFVQSFLIILREGLEAILVIGAVVTFLIKTGHRDRLRSIWTGATLAVIASAATAILLQTTLRAMPTSREILEGTTMLVAVAVLFSVSYWLISKVEAAKWQRYIRVKVSAALEHGGGRALAMVAFLAVYREGAETALFYQALFNEGAGATFPLLLGILAGFTVLAVIFTFVYRFGIRIPLRPFFAVTSTLLYFMAFVFMGKGIRELQEGNVLPVTVLPGFPQLDALGIYPTVETLLAQLVLLALFVFALAKSFWPTRSIVLQTMEPQATDVRPEV